MPSTRETIIRAALALLDGGGAETVTLRKVGALAGVSHNAPYKHFADREALLAAVAARELSRRVRVADGPGRALQRLQRLATDYVAWAHRYPARFKLTFSAWTEDHPEVIAAAEEARAAFVNAVIAAQAEGSIAPGPPERVSALVMAVAHGAADLAQAGHLPAGGRVSVDPEALLGDLFVLLQPRRR